MQGLDPTIIVLLLLVLVAVVAVIYQPTRYPGSWQLLADAFESKSRPSFPSYRNEAIFVDDYGHFDAELDDDGLWLLYDGPRPKQCCPCLRIPWTKIHFVKRSEKQHFFTIEAERSVRLMTGKEIGDAMMRRVGNPEKNAR